MIDANQTRFPTDGLATESSVVDKAYVGAMQVVDDKFGNEDLDVTALYANALIQTAPANFITSGPGSLWKAHRFTK